MFINFMFNFCDSIMNNFDRSNKIAGVYWLKQKVKDVKIKIAIKPQASVITLPKYEDFIDAIDLDKIETNETKEYIFSWQEKVFSAWEIDKYKDVNNCISELDHTYYNMIKTSQSEAKKLFSYRHENNFLPLPESKENNAYEKNVLSLNALMNNMNLGEKIDRNLDSSNSMHHLFRSNDNITIEDQQWISMYIVFDDSLYEEDSQLLLKQEQTLVSMYYNTIYNYLIVTPDTNDLGMNPYSLVTQTGAFKYHYGIEVIAHEEDSNEELVSLLNRLHAKWEKRHNTLVNFAPPPFGRTKIYVALEIMKAQDFDADDLYIEFEIRIPENVKCVDTVRGRSHLAKATVVGGTPHWMYGQTIELELEVDDGIDPAPVQVFLEAISTDWWGRHRTEGYCYLPLPPNPGYFNEQLSCSMPEEKNKMDADNRRFFVGGCHLIKDLEILTKPLLQDANFTFTETGKINVRWSTMRHDRPSSPHVRLISGDSSSSALLQGAEAVLRQYSQARARLAAATKDLE